MTFVHAQAVNTSVEGEDSPSATVFTRDIYPPSDPTGLQAVFSSIGQRPFIDLSWAPNLESDLAGYNVYRSVDGSEPVRLNKQVVGVPSYRDDDVKPGKTYHYSVSAVVLRGNESQHSAEATLALLILGD